MTIKRSLLITSIVFLTLALAMLLVSIWQYNEMDAALARMRVSQDIVRTVSNLDSLADDYRKEPRERVCVQWKMMTDELVALFRQAEEVGAFDSKTMKRLANEKANVEAAFAQLVEAHNKQTGHVHGDRSGRHVLTDQGEMLVSMVHTQLLSMVSDASRLNQSYQTQVLTAHSRSKVVLALLLAMTTAIILGNYIMANRVVIKPLAQLAQDAAIVGRGNLDHVSNVQVHNEVGDLADAFDEMTADLKATYTTLEGEIEERKKVAEELMQHKADLEDIVARRTDELTQANKALQTEIAERRRVQEDLEAEKNFSDLTIDSLPGVFYLFDQQGGFIRWNNNFEKVTGYHASEISALHPTDLFSEEEKPIVAGAIEKVFVDGEGSVEADFVSKDGRSTPFFLTGLLATIGGKQYLLGTGIDITQLREATAALERHAYALDLANKELEQFAYISSHHLQEPLRKIVNFSQLLVQRLEGKLDEQTRAYFAYVIDGAARMKTLIEDLLTYTSLDRREPLRERISLQNLIQAVLSDLAPVISAAQAVVVIEDMPHVDADAKEMRRLFGNILSNGVTFRREETPHIQVFARREQDHWVFSIRDNGIGIDPLYADKVFGIFEKLHPVGKYPGTGIGLALCKKIVERHGGSIWFESQPGEGSVFYFTIPETDEKNRKQAKATHKPASVR